MRKSAFACIKLLSCEWSQVNHRLRKTRTHPSQYSAWGRRNRRDHPFVLRTHIGQNHKSSRNTNPSRWIRSFSHVKFRLNIPAEWANYFYASLPKVRVPVLRCEISNGAANQWSIWIARTLRGPFLYAIIFSSCPATNQTPEHVRHFRIGIPESWA